MSPKKAVPTIEEFKKEIAKYSHPLFVFECVEESGKYYIFKVNSNSEVPIKIGVDSVSVKKDLLSSDPVTKQKQLKIFVKNILTTLVKRVGTDLLEYEDHDYDKF